MKPKKEKKYSFNKKLDAEVCIDLAKLRDKATKAYHFTKIEEVEFFWSTMGKICEIIERHEK